MTGLRNFLSERLSWVDPKWVIGLAVAAVSIGSVANFRVGLNADDITEAAADQKATNIEVHQIELRTVRLETQLENIENTTNEILREVKK